ncbi:MAG: hypothetical protein QXP98_05510 [Thermoproteus sp.]
MEARYRAKIEKISAKSGDIINAERYIVASDDGRHYLLALSDGKPIYTYLISYDLTKYEVVGEAELKCARCGGPLTKFYIFRDVYGECDRGHLNHVGVIVAWQRHGGESGESSRTAT